jgi:hypothetical protein
MLDVLAMALCKALALQYEETDVSRTFGLHVLCREFRHR